MPYKVHFHEVLICIFLMQVLLCHALPCDSCGNECASACGTKHFRTCCFNYLRKRTDPNIMKSMSNKRLIDFILLQGHAMFSQNDRTREHDERLLKEAARAASPAALAYQTASPKDILHSDQPPAPPLYYA